ncbi:hypothetical protein EJF36_09785 [Bacillus sp. HMF5848]|uniref:hypothetical protein n=1 Tax=Bacillus sp. HMF5848 TaxID=2495421 RepID=UPI000F770C14|nr:hypothetical protein [Bacillus sp. HMF5848]RSK27145.1 hypothetical protein EJF36_09785 [Bacillus sp. HMF5848]
MAFGVSKRELNEWKRTVLQGDIAFLTHYWYDSRFPHLRTVTKVGCSDIQLLVTWGLKYELKKEWIHHYRQLPHFDLMGEKQLKILQAEGLIEHIKRFKLEGE